MLLLPSTFVVFVYPPSPPSPPSPGPITYGASEGSDAPALWLAWTMNDRETASADRVSASWSHMEKGTTGTRRKGVEDPLWEAGVDPVLGLTVVGGTTGAFSTFRIERMGDWGSKQNVLGCLWLALWLGAGRQVHQLCSEHVVHGPPPDDGGGGCDRSIVPASASAPPPPPCRRGRP